MAESFDAGDATQATDSEVYAMFSGVYRDETALTVNVFSAVLEGCQSIFFLLNSSRANRDLHAIKFFMQLSVL